MPNRFFTDFFNETQLGLTQFVGQANSSFAEYVEPIIRTGCVIYIVLYGFSIAFGKIREPISDSIWRNIKVAVILGLTIAAGSSGAYQHYVAGPAQSFPEEVGGRFLPTGSTGVDDAYGAIDRAFNAGWDTGTRFFDDAGFDDFGLYFMALGIWVATLLFTVYAAFLFLLSKIALAVLLAVGPLFIALALFEQTRRFTEAWIAQIVNYALIPVIAAGVLGLTITFFTLHATVGETAEVGFSQATFAMIIAFLSWVVLKQAPTIASGLAGGASLQGAGAFGGLMSLGRMVGGAAKSGFNRTPLGRELQVRRAGRQFGIQREGRELARKREERQTAFAERRREAFANFGTQAGRATARGVSAARSGITSGVEAMGRLRERLARRP